MRGKRGWSSADFIVVVFVLTAAIILFAVTATAIGLAIFTDKDVGVFFAIITDMMKTLIAALVGYLAGRRTNGNGGSSVGP